MDKLQLDLNTLDDKTFFLQSNFNGMFVNKLKNTNLKSEKY
jgi:hypothetical protein